MSQTVSISVVIATHFRDQLLERALRSALGQTYSPIEVIVVDDTNRDETRQVVERVAHDGNVEVRYVPRTSFSSAKSYNKGIALARGEFVALLDDDDEWHERYLEAVAETFRTRKVDFVLTPWLCRDEDGTISPGKKAGPTYSIRDWLLYNPGLIASNFAVRTACLRNVGGLDEHLPTSADRDLMIKLMQSGCTYAVQDEPLLYFSISTVGLTRGNVWKMPYSKLCLQKKYWRQIPFKLHLYMLYSISVVFLRIMIDKVRHGS